MFDAAARAGIALTCLLGATAASAQGVVNVYSNREPGQYSATLDEFSKATGIKVNAIFSEQGLAERIAAEGDKSPADVLITVDIGRLQQALDLGIARPLASEAVAFAVPAAYRHPDGLWTALSLRARTIYASKERVKDASLTYEDLADPKWKGRVCTRSFQHQYNLALVSAMLLKNGEARTKAWLEGVKANLAKKPSGGDRDVAKDIAAGACDLGLGNQYYVGLMLNGRPEQKAWAEAIRVILPAFEKGGTHVNVSGAVVAKHAPNYENAVKLVEYMTNADAQRVFADVNYEYPVRANVPVNALVASFGELRPDPASVAEIARQRKRASELVDEVAFDR